MRALDCCEATATMDGQGSRAHLTQTKDGVRSNHRRRSLAPESQPWVKIGSTTAVLRHPVAISWRRYCRGLREKLMSGMVVPLGARLCVASLQEASQDPEPPAARPVLERGLRTVMQVEPSTRLCARRPGRDDARVGVGVSRRVDSRGHMRRHDGAAGAQRGRPPATTTDADARPLRPHQGLLARNSGVRTSAARHARRHVTHHRADGGH